MKTFKHLLLGLVASLLFAAGFAQAADRVDLMVQGPSANHEGSGLLSAKPCASGCDAPGGL